MKPHIVECDDGSILIEWADPDRRFGISIEPDEESFWYYVDRNRMIGDTLPEFLLERLK